MMIGDWFGDWAGEWFGDGCGNAPIRGSGNREIADRSVTHPIARSPLAHSPMLLLVLVTLTAPACSQRTYANDDPSKTHVGIVFDIGGKDDRSFNAAAWRGVHCAETGKFPDGVDCGKPARGIVLRAVEPGAPVNIEPAIRSFAERGYDLIIGVGFAQAPIIEAVPKDYHTIHFAVAPA